MIPWPPGTSRLAKTTEEGTHGVLDHLAWALYLTLFFLLGLATLRKGHYFLFFVGIIFPVLWIVGALLGPTQRAQAAGVR